jgi:ssDNA-binding replication factor A large subunit
MEVVILSDGKYETEVKLVLQEASNADPEEVAKEFERYENEFLIPPRDALRSVVRKFMDPGSNADTTNSQPALEAKKVARFSELGSNDRNVSIEVMVSTYNSRMQQVRGEERQIGFGFIEDSPWEGDRTRWEFKDWGNKSQDLLPNSVVRLEGVSVNEWNGKRSININQTSRVSVLKEGSGTPVVPTSEPITIQQASQGESTVSIVARVLSVAPDQIVRRDGSGVIDVVRGRVGDQTGSIGFLSWRALDVKEGDLVKIENAQVKRFRDTPEINIGDYTKIEPYHDGSFPSTDDIQEGSKSTIMSLRDGMRDVEIELQVVDWSVRSFTTKDGETREVRSGEVQDPSGRCRLTSWGKVDLQPGSFIRVTGARVQAWQGSPDLVMDDPDQIEILEKAPFGPIDSSNHWVEEDLDALTSGGSRRGVSTTGRIVSVRSDSGIILRCTKEGCRRVLRDGMCGEHGEVEGSEDLRLMMVIDSGVSNASLLVSREPAESVIGKSFQNIAEQIRSGGRDAFAATLKERFLGRRVTVNGRAINDDRGCMIQAESVSVLEANPVEIAESAIERWGVVL